MNASFIQYVRHCFIIVNVFMMFIIYIFAYRINKIKYKYSNIYIYKRK